MCAPLDCSWPTHYAGTGGSAPPASYGPSVKSIGADRRPPMVIPWITGILSLVSVVTYAIPASGFPMPLITGSGKVHMTDPLHIVGLGARSTPLVADVGEGWRLLTCHFVHTSWLHLLFNLAFLFAVGGALEQVTRRGDYAALILFTGTAASMSSLLGTPQVSAGASGLVFGTLGAAVTLGLRHHQRLGRRVRRYFGLWVLPFLLAVFGFGIGNPSVDQASHLGGLIAGLFGGMVLPLRTPWPVYTLSPARPYTLFGAGIVSATCLLSAPLIARGGHPPRRVALPSGTSVEVPGTWASRVDSLGELEFVTAGGMVVLSIDRMPRSTEYPTTWYEVRRLLPNVATMPFHTLEPETLTSLRLRGHDATRVRYQVQRDGTPMVRDVYFMRAKHGSAWTTVLSIETPLTWSGKYDGVRAEIVGSLRETGSENDDAAISMAALR